MLSDVHELLSQWSETGDPAQRIAAAIWDDVTDRRGWRQAADSTDDEIKVEIVERWVELIRAQIGASDDR